MIVDININEAINKFDSLFVDNDNNESNDIEVVVESKTNVVSGEKLRDIQERTLEKTAGYLANTFGPMGSNTKIISGMNQSDISSSYSKDGLKVLSKIINNGPIEASIVEELVEITKAVEKEVGDGTTSTVILASLIFKRLRKIEKYCNIPPYELIRRFKKIVGEIKEKILEEKQECTLEDIYDISMISTNGNEEVSKNIKDIYEQYGMGVDISVGISNSNDSLLKVYDGLTITEGMADPVFINNATDNTSEIHEAEVYHFADPIDTMDMIALFESIITQNIYDPYANDESPVPTVITCPKLSRDMSATMKQLANQLYQFGESSNKPPILIISDVVASDELIMDDIANLCGCKSIRKYIDQNIYKKDVEEGKAPTVENIKEFAGYCELVVADAKKTKFINPKHMCGDEEDPIYTAMVNFLETEIKNDKDDDAHSKGLLKKRLAALKANMVDYLVGGVTISERDALKDLVEDAVKNCKSASIYGVGYAANYMGLKKSYELYSTKEGNVNYSSVDKRIIEAIFISYCDITRILYGTVCYDIDTVDEFIIASIENGYPFNISTGNIVPKDMKVKCSIMLDINILDTLSKIITIMVTSNQCLLQSSNINTY